MTFKEFCNHHSIHNWRIGFKNWLGDDADSDKSLSWWMQKWDEFLGWVYK